MVKLYVAPILLVLASCSPPSASHTNAQARPGEQASNRTSPPVARQAEEDDRNFLFETADAGPAPAMLSEFGAFQDMARQIPAAGVIPYALNTEHFADFARVKRFFRVPEGSPIRYSIEGVLAFPVGTVLLQTFSYPSHPRDPASPDRAIETRVMRRMPNGWDAVAYLWNAEGTDARRAVAGGIVSVSIVDGENQERSLRYIVMNTNDCKRCHENQGVMLAIGPTVANLNRDFPYPSGQENQLASWTRRGILVDAPASPSDAPRLARWDDPSDGTIEQRARAWLHVNCAHCHNPRGAGGVSGLDLRLTQENPIQLGIYKPPVAAGRGSEGRQYSIDPGNPRDSFLVGRLTSTEPSVMMPPVGRRLSNGRAITLVSEWISGMHFSQTESQKIIARQRERFEDLKREGKWQE